MNELVTSEAAPVEPPHMELAVHPSWPEAAGVPLYPEQNGAHQLTHATPDYPNRGPWVLLWCAVERLWTDLYGYREPPEAMASHRYIGPMRPPAEPGSSVAGERRAAMTQEARDTQMRNFIGSMVRVGKTGNAR